ncbi:GntR family transcriptional regulator [Vibrio sp.]|nr:GntR family transcriptional regulator [Vibrio sp.]
MSDYKDHALEAILAARPQYIKSASLSDQIYMLLKELILDRKIPDNSVMSESKLATELNVSRTPIREAFVRLAGENLLVRQGARSYAVRSVDIKEYLDSMVLREVLEVEAVKRAIDRIDPNQLSALIEELEELMNNQGEEAMDENVFWRFDEKLHDCLANASGNLVLAHVLSELRANVRLFRLHSPLHRQDENHNEHLDLLKHMKNKDVEMSTQAIKKHIQNLRNDVISSL